MNTKEEKNSRSEKVKQVIDKMTALIFHIETATKMSSIPGESAELIDGHFETAEYLSCEVTDALNKLNVDEHEEA